MVCPELQKQHCWIGLHSPVPETPVESLVHVHVNRDLLNKAKEKTGGVPDDEKQQQFNGIADDVEVLQEQLQQLLGEAEGIACANPRVVCLISPGIRSF